MSNEVLLTSEGYEKLSLELETLKTEGRRDIAEKIKVARSFGDLSENSEYDEAMNEQGRLEARINEIENILKSAKILDRDSMTGDSVHLGSTVVLENVTRGSQASYVVLGENESASNDIDYISSDSPIGRALIGKKAGEVFDTETPGGSVEYRIVTIS